jgi:FkbM family methyltransferase
MRYFVFSYSNKLPFALSQRDWTIGFHYPDPIGNICLLLRANAGADAFIHSEVFEHQYYRLPLSRPPATILDLGANIGLSTVYFSRVFPTADLACVEPVSKNLRVLRRNLKLNNVRALVFPAAIHSEDGSVLMEATPMDYDFKVARANGQGAVPLFEVPAISVPAIMRQLRWDRIGLLKIDIEGHEKELLTANSDWLNLVEAICIECHDEFGATELDALANRFHFSVPRWLSGIWFMERKA